MKPIVAAALVFASLSVCSATTLGETSSTEHVIKIAPTQPDSSDPWGFGLWKFDGDWSAEGRYLCTTQDKLFDVWPRTPTCEGRLTLVPSSITAPGISSLDRYLLRHPSGNALNLQVSGKSGTSETLFELLVEQKTPVVAINSRMYELEGFLERASTGYEVAFEDARSTVLNARLVVIGKFLGGLAIMLLAVSAIRRAAAVLPAIVTRVWDVIVSSLGRASREYKKIRLRRVIEDEVIRQMTRSAVMGASEPEKVAIRGQIKQALDNGNYELARSLRSVLKQIEGD